MNLQKYILHICVTILCIVSGCDKSPVNGDLDGQWQVMSVEPQRDSVLTERMYYCFSLHVCQLSFYDYGVCATGNLVFDGDHLSIDFRDFGEEDGAKYLPQFGIDSNPVTFTVVSLGHSRLTLRNGDTVVILRKF